MADSGKVELVIEVDVGKANAGIKSVNTGLSSIEQTAVRATRGASQGIDGMTASMVKGATAGNLFADAIKKALEFAKSWTIEAAKAAAQEDRAAAVTGALAKAHGDGAAAAQKAVEAIREVGYTTADATISVQKLIIADIGLEKAKGLAKIAKDASAVSTEGISAADAFEKIMLAIETGQSRGLRSLSLFPKMAEAEEVARLQAQLHGKTLDDNEVKQIRYNAIVEAAKKIQDANTAAAQSATGQMAAMGREVEELKDDIGKTFQGELKAVVGLLRGMVSFFGEHTDAISKFAKGTLVLAGIVATITAATKAWALAQGALNLAMAANPAFLLAGGIIGAGAVIWKEYSDMRQGWEDRTKQMETDALRKDVGSGKVKLDDLRKRGMTDDQIRELISGRKLAPGETFEDIGAGLPKLKIGGGPDPEALKLQLEIQKKQRENAEYFKDQSIAAVGAGKTGYVKDVADMNAEIARRTKFTDDKGTHAVPLTKSAWESIIDTMQKKLQAFKDHFALENKKALADYLKDEEEKNRKAMEYEAHRFQQRLAYNEEIAKQDLDHIKDLYQVQEQQAGFVRDRQLRQLEGADAQTLKQKLWVEQRKADIEVEYLQKVNEIKLKLYDMDAQQQLLEVESAMTIRGYQTDEIEARIAKLKQDQDQIRQATKDAGTEAIDAARENATNRQTQMVRDHYRSMFDSLKQQAGGVFDALLQKSQSVWSAIGNSFKTAILTAIKEVVTSRVAATLMYMFTGQKVSFAGGGAGPGGSGGMLGGLGGLLGIGAVPVFGGTTGGWTPGSVTPPGGMALAGGGMTQQQAAQIILGTAAGGGGAAAGGGGGVTSKAGIGFLGNLKQAVAGWKDMLTRLGNIGFKPERWSMDEAGNMTKIADAKGIGGMKGGVMLAAGAMLAMDGLRRGGKIGVAETTAGGALIGAKFGGPLGALIGGVAGFAAGMVRLFIKGAVEKARQKIKDLYGVDISDKSVLQQIVDTAKQSYGGNLDMAIRTAQIRDLIQLYAMSTGQQTKGMPANMTPLSLVERGGSLFQSTSYSNGTALPGLGGMATLDSIGNGTLSGAGTATPTVRADLVLDPDTVEGVLAGRIKSVILSNPRLVSSSNVQGMRASVGRRDSAATIFAPGTVLA